MIWSKAQSLNRNWRLTLSLGLFFSLGACNNPGQVGPGLQVQDASGRDHGGGYGSGTDGSPDPQNPPSDGQPGQGQGRDGGGHDGQGPGQGGAPRPVLENGVDFADWFKDYDQGLGTDYLRHQGSVHEAGDPRHPELPRHRFIQDIAYGPHSRNRMDIWIPSSGTVRGVALWFHGGSFISGSRADLRMDFARRLLEAGVAVASADYRFSFASGRVALAHPEPQGEGSNPQSDGARLDYIMRDGARAVQFLRYLGRQLGISNLRVAVSGESAGGGAAAWIGFSPEMAVPNHPDPVLRESTRIQAVGHVYSQVTYRFSRWPELLGVPRDMLERLAGDYPAGLLQMETARLWDDRPVHRVLDYYALMGPGDPPLWAENMNPRVTGNTDLGTMLHLPRGTERLYEACVAKGLDCTLRLRDRSVGRAGSLADFFIAELNR